jgi:hypothetical protein
MVQRVPSQGLDLYYHGLLHLVAGYFADPDLTVLFHGLFPAELPLSYYGVDPGNLLLDARYFPVIYQLPGRQFKPQVEEFLMCLFQSLG